MATAIYQQEGTARATGNRPAYHESQVWRVDTVLTSGEIWSSELYATKEVALRQCVDSDIYIMTATATLVKHLVFQRVTCGKRTYRRSITGIYHTDNGTFGYCSLFGERLLCKFLPDMWGDRWQSLDVPQHTCLSCGHRS